MDKSLDGLTSVLVPPKGVPGETSQRSAGNSSETTAAKAHPPSKRPASRIRRSRVGILVAMLCVGLIAGWAANAAFRKSASDATSEGSAIGSKAVVAANLQAIVIAKKQGYAAGRKSARHDFPPVVKHRTVTETVSLFTVPASAAQATAMWAVHTTPLPSGYCHVTKVSNDSAYALMSFQACPGNAARTGKSEWFRGNGGGWSSLGQSGGCQIPQQYRRAFGLTYC